VGFEFLTVMVIHAAVWWQKKKVSVQHTATLHLKFNGVFYVNIVVGGLMKMRKNWVLNQNLMSSVHHKAYISYNISEHTFYDCKDLRSSCCNKQFMIEIWTVMTIWSIKSALAPTPPPYMRILWVLTGSIQPKREVGHTLSYISEVKYGWSFTITLPFLFLTRYWAILRTL
jgi:hypothetical protein